jgi:hypothetical protein
LSTFDADLLLDGTFYVSNNSVSSLRRGLEEIFVDRGIDVRKVGASGFFLESGVSPVREYGPYSAWAIHRNGAQAFHGVAVSMTNTFRTQSSSDFKGIGLGTVFLIRWWWMALPVLVTFVTYVFLALCIYLTACQEIPIWKSSSLPVLKFGAQHQDLLDEKQHVSEMEGVAKKTKLALIQSRYGM